MTTLATSPTLPAPAPSPMSLATDLRLLVLAADGIALASGVYPGTNLRGIAQAWRDAKAYHFAELAKRAGVTIRQGTFAMFCAELERRACS